ncbi:ABC transporter substrate-binding protein [Enterovirga sp. CN4-39]|uniref:ABC transporter substrate-binding protein n=1 Tax=Enterovirga sp. CN4-39 TaxID=3400910 RepID=UPI003C0C5E40
MLRANLFGGVVTACLASLSFAGEPASAQQISGDVVKIGVLTDMSSIYADFGGRGSVTAAQMAIEDFGGNVAGKRIELIFADHQNKADIGSNIARQWMDQEGVDAIVDLPNSGVALAVQQLAKERGKVLLITSAVSSDITGKSCTPTSVHWTYDTYSLAQGTGTAVVQQGGDSWFFITADYAFGHALERDTGRVVTNAGGKVLGSVRHPLSTPDFSSFLLTAQSSRAKVVGLANGGGDMINAIKQAAEFGIVSGGQRLASLLIYINDVHSLGLKTAQGLVLTSPFYWDQTEDTRAWSKRFLERQKIVPSMVQGGVYGAITHYLKAIAATSSDDGPAVTAKMREMPINDFMTKNGTLRVDGRVVRDMYLFEVKSPAESKYDYDYYKQLAVIPGEKAFRPLSQSECPLVPKGG